MFISWDIQIYDRKTRSPTKVQTSTLNEDLGQVKYIFTDKTGTLTKNYMEFARLSIGSYEYGTNQTMKLNLVDNFGKITNFQFYDPKFDEHINNNFNNKNDKNLTRDVDKEAKESDHCKNMQLYLNCLSLCHTVIVHNDSENINEKLDDINIETPSLENPMIGKQFEKSTKKEIVIDKLNYQSSSPDELALVNAARYFKHVFVRRDIQNNIYINENGKDIRYELLHVIEYTSDRKRMSVIVRFPNNRIYLLAKGADSIVKSLVTQNIESIPKTEEFLLSFARKGLRTLMIAYKEIDIDSYNKFVQNYTVIMQINDKNQKTTKLNRLYDDIEQGLYVLGSTAIEDKLQDDVCETLESFINTGINVWVLTGDKKDTAKSIAFSCRLLTHDFTLFEITEGLPNEDLRKQLNEYLARLLSQGLDEGIKERSEKSEKYGLIISAEEITKVTSSDELLKVFYEVAIRCNSVLCCRVSPKQKALVVNIVKNNLKDITTLAIGDGANDVNMITAAHVGIGIFGVEGRQAARASDYAIAQFSFLKRLLFVHGRESYRKNAYVVCYNFYKNALFVMPQFW